MGYEKHDVGSTTVTQTDDGGVMYHQNTSRLNTNHTVSSAMNEANERSYQDAVSQNEVDSKSYTESAVNTARDVYAFSQHLANDSNYSENLSKKMGYDVSESSRYAQNVVTSFSKQHGITEKESADLIFGGSFMGSGGNVGIGTHRAEVYQDAQNISNSDEFQKHFQKVVSSAKSDSFNVSDSEGNRMAKDLSSSFDKMESAQSNYTSSLSHMTQIQSRSSAMNTCSQSTQSDLTQRFVGFASDRFGKELLTNVIRNNDHEKLAEWSSEFMDSVQFQNSFSEKFGMDQPSNNEQVDNLSKRYHLDSVDMDVDKIRKQHESSSDNIIEKSQSAGLVSGATVIKGGILESHQQSQTKEIEGSLQIQEEFFKKETDSMEQQVNDKKNTGVAVNLANRVNERFGISGKMTILGEQITQNGQ
jgi:hypothetical protein